MLNDYVASEMLRDAVAPSGDLSKLCYEPIPNFGSKILHTPECVCRRCQIYGARLTMSEEIFQNTENLNKLLKLDESSFSYDNMQCKRGFVVQCTRNRNKWCRDGSCKFHYFLGMYTK